MAQQRFSGRGGLLFASLALSLGLGNFWRMPRAVARWEDGTFLIPWLIALFVWSLPILVAELAFGRATRSGAVGAFSRLLGSRSSWMGAVLTVFALGVGAMVAGFAGWSLRYGVAAIRAHGHFPTSGSIDSPSAVRTEQLEAARAFAEFAGSGSVEPVWYLLGAVALGALLVGLGLRLGIELVGRIVVPVLFVLLLGGTTFVFLEVPGATAGLSQMFVPHWDQMLNSRIWVEALVQAAWSTGAGLGVVIAMGASARTDEDAAGNGAVIGLSAGLLSLLATLFVFTAAFALLGSAGLASTEIAALMPSDGAGQTGLAFTTMTFLFARLGEAGGYCTMAFFVAMFLASLATLMALMESLVRVVRDFGLPRPAATFATAILLGGTAAVAALDLSVLATLEWSSTLGLLVGGVLIAMAVHHYGVLPFRDRLINATSDRRLGPGTSLLLLWGLPVQGVLVLIALLTDAASTPNGADPFHWGLRGLGTPSHLAVWILTPLILFAPWIGRASLRRIHDEDSEVGAPEEPRARWLPRLLLLPIPYAFTIAPLRAIVFDHINPWIVEQWSRVHVALGEWIWVPAAALSAFALGGTLLLLIGSATRRENQAKREARAATRQLRREEVRDLMAQREAERHS